jgi:hypothetical protein
MKIVKESISFERGGDPKNILGIGEKARYYKDSILGELNKIKEENNIKRPIDYNFNKEVDNFWARLSCNNGVYEYWIIYNRKKDIFIVVFDDKSPDGELFRIQYQTLEECIDFIKRTIADGNC